MSFRGLDTWYVDIDKAGIVRSWFIVESCLKVICIFKRMGQLIVIGGCLAGAYQTLSTGCLQELVVI